MLPIGMQVPSSIQSDPQQSAFRPAMPGGQVYGMEQHQVKDHEDDHEDDHDYDDVDNNGDDGDTWCLASCEDEDDDSDDENNEEDDVNN